MNKFLFCLCALLFLHCTEVPEYGILKVGASPAVGGSVQKNPSGPEYENGTTVTLTAEAKPDYMFASWSGNVRETNANRAEITINGDEIVIANFVKKLDPPANITATTYDGDVTVKWNSVPNATGYRIYRSTSPSGTYTLIGTSTTTSYTDNTVSSGITYYYEVSAYNNNGESSKSSYVSVATSLNVPTGLTVTINSATSVTVSWQGVPNATGYRIYRSTSSNGSYSQIGTSTSTSYTDNIPSSGTTYYYEVAAYNSSGESQKSNYASVTALSAPTGVTATASNTSSSITVGWSSVSSAAGYRIYRSTSSSGYYTYIGSSTSISYLDAGLSPGTTYYYKVAAQSSNGVESSQSNYVSATTNTMNAPSNVKPKPDAEECNVVITWSSVPNATEYRIYRNTSSSGTFTQIDNVYADYELSCTDYDFDESSKDKKYFYKVEAYNEDTDEKRQSSYVWVKFLCNDY